MANPYKSYIFCMLPDDPQRLTYNRIDGIPLQKLFTQEELARKSLLWHIHVGGRVGPNPKPSDVIVSFNHAALPR